MEHSLVFEDYDSRLDVARRVLLGKKCACDIEKRREYGSIMYSYFGNGKWLMDFHGSLLMFLFYLEYEKNIAHTRIIYKVFLCSYINYVFLL